MFEIDPSQLSESRLQLHWAAQLLAAAADATLEKSSDDSHSNLGWDTAKQSLVGRSGVRLQFPGLTLVAPDGEAISLEGKTLEHAKSWLEQRLGTKIQLRDYEMPPHPVSSGATFEVDDEQIRELSAWFSLGQQVMSPISPCRVWPHHFDLGWLVEIDGPSISIGGGLSPGDASFDRPYLYLNPYGVPKPQDLPNLAAGGHWAENWFGAVVTADKLLAAEDAKSAASAFVNNTYDLIHSWYR